MSIRTHLISAITIVIATNFTPVSHEGTAAAVASPAVSTEQAGHVIRGADDEQEQTILDAIYLYENAGLELPPLKIHVHEDSVECEGAPGLYSKGGDLNRIDLCAPSMAMSIHELAHAWERHNVKDSTRAEYMDETGAVVWNSHEVSHPARGVEQFAHTIEWGLKTEKIQRISLPYHERDIRLFELATGLPTLRISEVDNPGLKINRPIISSNAAPEFS